MSARYHGMTKMLIAHYMCGDGKCSDFTLNEMQKLCVNSHIFLDYIKQMEKAIELDDQGFLDINETELANLWKCLMALAESRKSLLVSSISLSTH